jgi:hypothetical protein
MGLKGVSDNKMNRPHAQAPSWRTTHCRLSATAYSIYSQLPSIAGRAILFCVLQQLLLTTAEIIINGKSLFRKCTLLYQCYKRYVISVTSEWIQGKHGLRQREIIFAIRGLFLCNFDFLEIVTTRCLIVWPFYELFFIFHNLFAICIHTYNQQIVCWEARAGRGVLCNTPP